ncbi:glycosyl transferase, group 1 family protein [Candidatus Moduliflexus flocculans]|uniref:Glycosyl transferase, group 1 family protein n=1 Tax=Candidatus Moduliflexus flocculans TaxID=1499966 RepID=A0A0S6VR04_9BACT|nr:glycosyl transferase, group 1 family protein [Candidatus Moduliflexus flocculans]
MIDKLTLHGTQKFLLSLTQELTPHGFEQRVYCLKNEAHPANLNAFRQAGIEVIIIGATLRGIWRMIADWLAWKPDIVFTLLFYSDQIGRIVAKIAAVPVIISSIRAQNIYKQRWHFWCDRLTARFAQKIVFNAKSAIPFALRHEGVREAQVVYIPNGVNPPAQALEKQTCRRQLEIPPTARIIVSIGRLAPQKGFDCLLQAFRLVAAQFPDVCLLIIGQGAQFAELQMLAVKLGVSRQTRFLGERTDIDTLLACADLYVQASHFEGMPNALMEAMAAGIPAIATAVDGARDIVEDGVTGWLTPPGDAEQLAAHLCEALRYPEIAAQIGAHAARSMAERFSVEQMAAAYETLFRALLSP